MVRFQMLCHHDGIIVEVIPVSSLIALRIVAQDGTHKDVPLDKDEVRHLLHALQTAIND